MDKTQYKLFNPTSEHEILRQTLVDFVKSEVEKQAFQNDREEKFNLSLFKKTADLGLLGLTVDPQYGGAGMDAVATVIAHEELSASDPGFCLAYIAHAVLCTHNIFQNANEEQKKRWLPKLCSGQWVGAMAMSEAMAGTDVFGMQSKITKSADHFILNGRKMWITNGVQDEQGTPADCVLVYALSSKKQVSTCVVERGFEGYKSGQKIKDKTGMRASYTAELVFDDCCIPVQNFIGKEGDSVKHMMRNLEIERLALAGMSLGIAKRALREMNTYATDRKAFGKSIREFGQIQKYLAESYGEYMACRSFVYHTAGEMDLTQAGGRMKADTAKLISAQMGTKVASRAMQIMGGYGYVGEYHVERLWRDARLLEIGGGTNEALEKNIAKDLEKYKNI